MFLWEYLSDDEDDKMKVEKTSKLVFSNFDFVGCKTGKNKMGKFWFFAISCHFLRWRQWRAGVRSEEKQETSQKAGGQNEKGAYPGRWNSWKIAKTSKKREDKRRASFYARGWAVPWFYTWINHF